MSEYTKLSSAYIKEDFVNNQEIRSVADPSYCLTVQDNTFNAPIMSKCNNSPSQKFTYLSDKQIKMPEPAVNKCLASNEKHILGQWDCDSTSDYGKRWNYSPSTNTIQNNKYSGFLELSSPSTVSINKTGSSSPSQKWFGSNGITDDEKLNSIDSIQSTQFNRFPRTENTLT
jgi:hypothetical protein